MNASNVKIVIFISTFGFQKKCLFILIINRNVGVKDVKLEYLYIFTSFDSIIHSGVEFGWIGTS